MGALCGKESRDDNFAGPGRRLDSSPPAEATAPLPKNKRVVVGGPPQRLGGSPQTLGGQTLGGSPQTLGGSPRTLGGSPRTLGESTTVGGGSGGASAADDADPGSMAGKAAEVRCPSRQRLTIFAPVAFALETNRSPSGKIESCSGQGQAG